MLRAAGRGGGPEPRRSPRAHEPPARQLAERQRDRRGLDAEDAHPRSEGRLRLEDRRPRPARRARRDDLRRAHHDPVPGRRRVLLHPHGAHRRHRRECRCRRGDRPHRRLAGLEDARPRARRPYDRAGPRGDLGLAEDGRGSRSDAVYKRARPPRRACRRAAARRRARSRARSTAMSASSSGPWAIRFRPLREARNASSAVAYERARRTPPRRRPSLAVEALGDPPGDVGVVEREGALHPGAEDRDVLALRPAPPPRPQRG